MLFFGLIEREADTHDENSEDDDERVVYWDLIEIDDKHLCTDEGKDKCKTDRQIAESIDNPRESKVERPESHDSEDIRSIDDELILSDREDRWDAVDCEYEISSLYKYKTHKERCPIEFCLFSDEELISVKLFFKWDDFTYELDNIAFFWIDFHLASRYELIGSIEKDRTEYIDNPVKILEKRDSSEDKYHTEEYRSEHSPEEDFVLIGFRYREVSKYDRKDEDIVDREGFFYEVSCEKFESFLLSEPLVNKTIKYESKRYPNP